MLMEKVKTGFYNETSFFKYGDFTWVRNNTVKLDLKGLCLKKNLQEELLRLVRQFITM